MPLSMDIDSLRRLMETDFPSPAEGFELIELTPMKATIRMPVRHEHMRPGGSVSGPAVFTLADVTFFVATLGMIGPKLLTVTTQANIHFLRKPRGAALIAKAEILKLGKSRSVGDVKVFNEAEPTLCVAHATLTYAIPPEKQT